MEVVLFPDPEVDPVDPFDSFIETNRLIHTDPRYNLGDRRNIFDVVQSADDDSTGASYKRLLLIRSGYEVSANHFWQTIAQTRDNYVLPQRDSMGSDGIVSYEIPVSARPLIAETKKYKNEAQNRMNNERIAYSLGKMVKKFADLSGLYVQPLVLESRSAIIDFIDEDTEPVMLTAPVLYVPAEVDITDFYAEMFDYDLTFRNPFIEAISE